MIRPDVLNAAVESVHHLDTAFYFVIAQLNPDELAEFVSLLRTQQPPGPTASAVTALFDPLLSPPPA